MREKPSNAVVSTDLGAYHPYISKDLLGKQEKTAIKLQSKNVIWLSTIYELSNREELGGNVH